MLKISGVYLIGNPEICQDPPSCGQDDQTLLIGTSTFYILFLLSLHRQHMHSQERLHHLLRFTPTPPAAIADQQQQSGEYADAIRAERFYYQSMASQYMKDY